MIGLLDVVRESALEHPLLVEYPPEQHPLVQTRFHQLYTANCAKHRSALKSLQGHHNGSLLSPLCQVDMLESFVQHFSSETLLVSSNAPLLGEATMRAHHVPRHFDRGTVLQSNVRSHQGLRGASAPSGFNQFNIFGSGMEIDLSPQHQYIPNLHFRESTNSADQSVRPCSSSTDMRSDGVRLSQQLYDEYDDRGSSSTRNYCRNHRTSGIATVSPSFPRPSDEAFIYTNREDEEDERDGHSEEYEIGEGILHELQVDPKCEDRQYQTTTVEEFEDDEGVN